MCGIIAIAGKGADKIDDAKVGAMLSCLAKRGPDDRGIERFPGCVLGQTRLSIVDLSPAGHQPMKDNSRPFTIVFNGEIYGYRELRQELEAKGHRFSTNSDTEVILKAYAEYGEACVSRLDGMFAFALWDGEKNQLFMARDRFGKKPLYYGFADDGTLLVASEIKSIFAGGLIQGEIDPAAVDNYLALMYVPPWKSIYSNIHVLPPAHTAVYRDDKIEKNRYWSLPERPIEASYAEAKERVKKLLSDAVKKRLVADVEVGALLSGGVDSTLVSYLAQRFSTHPLKTFSVGYGEHINELPFAEEAARTIGTDHRTLVATSDLIHELTEVIAYMDEPHADSSLFPQHLIFGLASSEVKVVLTGDGADELFMGYGWYWKYWNRTKLSQLKNAFLSNPFREHLKAVCVFSPADRKRLWIDTGRVNADIIGESAQGLGGNGMHKINLFDLTTYLPGQLLTKVDQTSMMHSVEARCPFLDYKLAEYVYNMPLEFKTDKKSGKILLKDILSEVMSREFVHRRKQGFNAPVKQWLREEKIRSFVFEKLGGEAAIYRFLKKAEVERLLSSFYDRRDDAAYYKIWTLLCLEIWLDTRI